MYDCDNQGGSGDTELDITSDMQSCYGSSYDFISGSGPEESGGIFSGGHTYDFTVHDNSGNGIDQGLILFQTRTAGTSNTWTDAYAIGDYQAINSNAPLTNTFTNGYTYESQITVAQTDEMRIAYHCYYGGWSGGYWDCWGSL